MKPKTKPTTDQALSLIAILEKHHTTKATAAKTDVILKNYDLGFTARQLRMVVEFIRKKDLASPNYLVSNTQVGYWLTKEVSEMKAFLNQELDRVSNQVDNIQPLRLRLMEKKKTNDRHQLYFFT